MFAEFEEYIFKAYGSKTLNKTDIQRICTKAAEMNIINSPNLPIHEPISTSELLEIIKQSSINMSKPSKEFTQQISPTEANNSLTVPRSFDKPENLQKLEKVLEAYLKYERKRGVKKTSYKSLFLRCLFVSACIGLGIYFSYTPAPY